MTRRRVLIVGASSVLGRGIAEVLGEEDYDLWLTHRTPSRGAQLRGAFSRSRHSHLDAQNAEDAACLVQEIADTWGALDGFVYAAGVGLLWPAAKTADAKVRDQWVVNVEAGFRLVRLCFPFLAAGQTPGVVWISSTMGLVGAGGMAAYGASKAALVGLTRALAIEWAERKIRVNAVAPGIVPSPLVEEMFKFLDPVQRAAIGARHPLGFGEPHDVGHAVAFLLSPHAK